ncbi:unnamed protein product, partial [Clonostachys chloroleuca]
MAAGVWLVCLIGGWLLLELIALVLLSVEHGQQVKLPLALSSSIHIILATVSLWGVAIIQIVAIIFTFTVIIKEECWWKWLIVLECIEVLVVVILAMIPNIPAPLELAYIAPFTSQVATVGILFLASREISFEIKRIVDHLLLLGFFIILTSATVLGHSLASYYTRLKLTQWLLYMAISTVGYRLPESSRRTSRADRGSELELAPTPGLRDDS